MDYQEYISLKESLQVDIDEAIKRVIRKGKVVKARRPGYKRTGNVFVRIPANKRIQKSKKLKRNWKKTKAKRKIKLRLSTTKRKRALSSRKGQRMKLYK